jgi:hypothetical protein
MRTGLSRDANPSSVRRDKICRETVCASQRPGGVFHPLPAGHPPQRPQPLPQPMRKSPNAGGYYADRGKPDLRGTAWWTNLNLERHEVNHNSREISILQNIARRLENVLVFFEFQQCARRNARAPRRTRLATGGSHSNANSPAGRKAHTPCHQGLEVLGDSPRAQIDRVGRRLIAAEPPVPAAHLIPPLQLVPALMLRQDASADGQQ